MPTDVPAGYARSILRGQLVGSLDRGMIATRLKATVDGGSGRRDAQAGAAAAAVLSCRPTIPERVGCLKLKPP